MRNQTMTPPFDLQAETVAAGVVLLVITTVVEYVFVSVIIPMANLVITRVGVGAVTVTAGAVVLPERITTGEGVIVAVTSEVDVTVRVEVAAVTVVVVVM